MGVLNDDGETNGNGGNDVAEIIENGGAEGCEPAESGDDDGVKPLNPVMMMVLKPLKIHLKWLIPRAKGRPPGTSLHSVPSSAHSRSPPRITPKM